MVPLLLRRATSGVVAGDREGWILAEEKRGERMGKVPVRVKAVVYSLSPYQQKVMSGLWKDLPDKIHKKVSENWINALLLVTPVVGTYTYAQHYQEKEKLAHRY